MKTCFLFPGQGAQYPGMAKDFWEASQKVKLLFEAASEYSGIDMKRLLFAADEAELKETDKTQIAVTLANLASSTVLKERGITVQGYAGFSLGEYSAFHEAGIIALQDLFPIVKARGEIMERVSRSADTEEGQAGMAAVIGLAKTEASRILKTLEAERIFLANHTSPTQIVLSGTSTALAKAEQVFKDAGARRVVRLRVSGPFHSPLIEQAALELKAFLADFVFHDPVAPVYSNVTAERVHGGDQAKELCIRQVVSTVRWVDEEKTLLSDGYTHFYETGPGSVLRGLWKAFCSEYPCLPAGKLEDIKTESKE
ncbi:MAG: ACP S-malonyltransferase [Spirochaetales bacterium]|nr:ACP S-malonyltransferase [Spirochaetales bacterium]